MNAKITTRALVAGDYDAVVALWQSAEGVELAEGDSREDITRYLARNPGLSRVAEVDGTMVGAVLCGHDGRRGLIYHLAVAQDHRGRGIGRVLVDECVAGLQRDGLQRAFILVVEDNHRGRDFWTARGFEELDDARIMGRTFR